jgi:hypothetical protein
MPTQPKDKKAWILLVVLISISVFSKVAKADITGSFKFDLSLKPQTTISEISPFEIAFEALLDLYIPLDGFKAGVHTAFGITGVEYVIFDMESIFPGWTIKDEFVFAVPFETTSGESFSIPPGELLFVKKRVEITLTYVGFTLKNLAIFEDVSFPDPGTDYPGASYGPSDQSFHFGNIITLSGKTLNGVEVELIGGLCADPDLSNSIKKKSWSGSVVCQDGKFELTVKKVTISNLIIGWITLSSVTKFKPATPVSETLTMEFTLADFIDVTATIASDNVTALSPSSATLKIKTDNITLTTSLGSDLSITSHSLTLNLTFDSLTLTITATLTPGEGMTSLSLNAGFDLDNDTSFTISTSFSGGPPGWSSTTFTLSSQVGGMGLLLDSTFTPEGLTEVGVGIEIDF